MKEKSTTATAKCPKCGTKYLVASGYCVKCQKKVAKPIKSDKKESTIVLTKPHLIEGEVIKKGVKIVVETTVISFDVDINQIQNLNKLPRGVQMEIKKADRITSSGNKELLGHIGRKLVWSAGGYWENDNYFYIKSFGSESGVRYSENAEKERTLIEYRS